MQNAGNWYHLRFGTVAPTALGENWRTWWKKPKRLREVEASVSHDGLAGSRQKTSHYSCIRRHDTGKSPAASRIARDASIENCVENLNLSPRDNPQTITGDEL